MRRILSARPSIKIQHLILLLSLYYSLVLNRALLDKLFQLAADSNLAIFPYTAPILLFCLLAFLFTVVSLPYVFKPFMIFLTLTSAIAMYGVEQYHILLGVSMMENVFETNQNELSTYISLSSVLFIMMYGILPSLFIGFVKIEYPKGIWGQFKPRLGVFLIGIIGIGCVLSTEYKNYASIGRNNHYLGGMIIPAQFFNSIKYLNKTYFTAPLPYVSLGDDAQIATSQNAKPTLVVLILGETARAKNFSYNGYERNTNPYTMVDPLISFTDVTSCGTYTARSVPCMFSDLGQNDFEKARAQSRDSLVDVIRKAGVETLWIENDGGDKGVARTSSTMNAISQVSPFCQKDYCYDESLIAPMKAFIESAPQNKFVVLHTMGSHGPTYWQRYPHSMEIFSPSCNQSDIENCTDEAIRNVYDNTIAYTDYFIAKTIETLKPFQSQYNIALSYISDHGESLGESGLYLHGTPYAIAPKEQTHVPWLLWLPEQYAHSKGIDKACVSKKASETALSHDNLFHSILGLYGIQTRAKSQQLDLFSSCKSHLLTHDA
ncbi:phosphoethanolamine transferase [Marinomonas gallaica]|uniref:phosphoethanolamine transferase n=1 Tax=Marinomonas gallaica TaxID=1806667 RepID=UPI003CE4E2F9